MPEIFVDLTNTLRCPPGALNARRGRARGQVGGGASETLPDVHLWLAGTVRTSSSAGTSVACTSSCAACCPRSRAPCCEPVQPSKTQLVYLIDPFELINRRLFYFWHKNCDKQSEFRKYGEMTDASIRCLLQISRN